MHQAQMDPTPKSLGESEEQGCRQLRPAGSDFLMHLFQLFIVYSPEYDALDQCPSGHLLQITEVERF